LPSIRVLDEGTAGRIAAGEVIERPASVVKELAENALDAGATRIEIDVAGADITVVDNGCGIAEEDVPLAFARHATSKITAFTDLPTVGTMGFRGEALPAIAAAARVEMTTRPPGSDAATRVLVAKGRVAECGPAAGAPGTTVRVLDLFADLPVRRKHLRSEAFEFGLVAELVGRLAMAWTEVSFVLRREGREVFFAPGGTGLAGAAAAVYGGETARQLIPFAGEGEGVSFRGLAGPPAVARTSRRYQALFVNGRWVKNYALTRAVEEAYRNLLLTGRFPLVVLDLRLDPHLVDVNVHPAKQDVRLLDEPGIGRLVREGVRRALDRHRLVPAWTGTPARPAPRPREIAFPLPGPSVVVREPPETPVPRERPVPAAALEEEAAAYETAFPSLTVVAWLPPTYILAGGGDGLYIIDQHAAHERVLYEKNLARAASAAPAAQILALPLPLELDRRQHAVLERNLALVDGLGFAVEPFGGSFLLRAAPAWAGDEPGDRLLADVLDILLEKGCIERRDLLERLVTGWSCKEAVKAGQRLDHAVMADLLRQLAATRAPYTCPHGRPTLVHIGERELLTRFKRIT